MYRYDIILYRSTRIEWNRIKFDSILGLNQTEQDINFTVMERDSFLTRDFDNRFARKQMWILWFVNANSFESIRGDIIIITMNISLKRIRKSVLCKLSRGKNHIQKDPYYLRFNILARRVQQYFRINENGLEPNKMKAYAFDRAVSKDRRYSFLNKGSKDNVSFSTRVKINF